MQDLGFILLKSTKGKVSPRVPHGFSKILRYETQEGSHWHLENGKHVYDIGQAPNAGVAAPHSDLFSKENMWSGQGKKQLDHDDISSHLAEHGLSKFDTPALRAGWLKHMPNVTPTEFLHGMFGKLHTTTGNFKDMQAFEFNGNQLSMSCADCYVHGAEANIYSRQFNFGDKPKEVYHDLLQLSSSSQGGGAVKKLFKETFPLYRKMGIEKITLSAGMDRGAYAWAKYGFGYDSHDTERGHIGWMKQRLDFLSKNERFDKAASAEHDAIRKVLNDTTNTNKLWQLADMKTPALNDHYGADIINEGDKNPSFIKELLRHTSYSGSLSFKDPVAMSRLARYIKQ